jgi:hypothetical protein
MLYESFHNIVFFFLKRCAGESDVSFMLYCKTGGHICEGCGDNVIYIFILRIES